MKKYLSICSGIEAATVAWHGLGWEPVGFAEIEPFPAAVLAHHYPGVPNFGDMTNFMEWDCGTVDIVVGGTPCQAFSVAGLRRGLADKRGNLALTFCELVDHFDPEVVVWENVPGVLSSKDNAFGCFLAGLVGADEPIVPGGKWERAGVVSGPKRTAAWRVLDAQYFGVAQRRRRVFVVAFRGAGNWRAAAALFPVGESLFGDTPPSREAREGSAAGAARSVALRGREGGATAELGDELAGCLRASGGGGDKPHALTPVAFGGNNQSGPIDVATARNASASASGRMDFETETFLVQPTRTLRGEGFDASEDGAGRGQPIVAVDCYNGSLSDAAPTLRAGNGNELGGVPAALSNMTVRRLTPRECELLQGFPAIRNNITIEVCLDRQKNYADVALQCRKWQTNALPADAAAWMQPANAAADNSSTSRANQEPLAALRVRTNSVDELLEIHSQGRLIWSASSADASSRSRLPMPSAAIAASLAPRARELAQAIMDGKVASPANIRLSFPARSGASSALTSGEGSAESASDATNDARLAKFTTSELGRVIPTCGSSIATSLCSALAAISSCIPGETLPANFSLILDVETPYTLIPMPSRRKAARADGDRSAEVRMAADGPRYKALGNSMAVPVMGWIGRRIAFVLRAY